MTKSTVQHIFEPRILKVEYDSLADLWRWCNEKNPLLSCSRQWLCLCQGLPLGCWNRPRNLRDCATRSLHFRSETSPITINILSSFGHIVLFALKLAIDSISFPEVKNFISFHFILKIMIIVCLTTDNKVCLEMNELFNLVCI